MRLALIGYGKMGKTIERIAISRGHQIVSIIDINNASDFESEAFKSAEVAIEFTAPTVAYQNYMRAFAANVPVVSGTTGWLEAHGEEIKALCNQGGKTLFWASNFSVGVNLFFALNRYLGKIMNGFPEYEVSMSETHHIHKLDAPSGTAITLAEELIGELDRKESWAQEQATSRTAIPIHSIREGEVPGIHTVTYESPIDSITITHDAKSREGFALGAVLAAEFTCGKRGLLGMKDLFPF